MKWFYKLIILVTGFLTGSCFLPPMFGVSGLEYGAPSARYNLSGKVVSSADNQPIEGIEIGFRYVQVYTDANGQWVISGASSSYQENSVTALDVDGPENGGSFAEKNQPINPVQTEEGDGNWYEGLFEQHDILIEMDEEL